MKDWEKQFDEEKLGCCYNIQCRFYDSDTHNEKLKNFIKNKIIETEKYTLDEILVKVKQAVENLTK